MLAPQRLVFTHIGKAGGSSASVLFGRIVQTRGMSVLGVSGASSINATADLSPRKFAAQNLVLADYQIVTGHVPFSTAWRYFRPAVFATALREPRARMISNYASQPNNLERPDFGMSEFIDYVRAHPFAECAIDNYQTRMLADAFNHRRPATPAMLRQAKRNLERRFSFVGRTEELGALLAVIGRLYGVSARDIPPANTTGPYQPHVTDEHLAVAGACNELDADLYSWALERGVFVKEPCWHVLDPHAAKVGA